MRDFEELDSEERAISILRFYSDMLGHDCRIDNADEDNLRQEQLNRLFADLRHLLFKTNTNASLDEALDQSKDILGYELAEEEEEEKEEIA